MWPPDSPGPQNHIEIANLVAVESATKIRSKTEVGGFTNHLSTCSNAGHLILVFTSTLLIIVVLKQVIEHCWVN